MNEYEPCVINNQIQLNIKQLNMFIVLYTDTMHRVEDSNKMEIILPDCCTHEVSLACLKSIRWEDRYVRLECAIKTDIVFHKKNFSLLKEH